jgi:hypothetical protein
VFFIVFFPPIAVIMIMDLRRFRPMARQTPHRKCKQCKTSFVPDPRCVKRQHYCSQPECRKASKVASQQRWLDKPANRDYFKDSTHVERVRAWRQAHPGYWRRKSAETPHALQALQEDSAPKPSQNQALAASFTPDALQDDLFRQPTVLVGLIAHLTGLALQDDIVSTTRRLQQLGRDILSGSPPHQGDRPDAQMPHFAGPTPARAQPIQLGGSALGP